MLAPRRWLPVALAAAGAAVLLAGCTDKDLERALGKQSSAEIESAYRLVDDPLLNSYVDTMGHILVGHSNRQDIPYRFRVIDTEVVNAAAAPYGYIYLTKGLLDFVDSEDELWAVTGHEIGHEVNRDTIKAVKQNMLLSLAALLIGRESRLGGDLAQLGFNLLSLKHSRDDEYRADDHGAAVTFAAGYDPQAETSFFQRLMTEVERDHPSRLETYFMTHPATKDRIARQAARPTGSLADAAALTQVAGGYARRACHATALSKLREALDRQPDFVPARVLLADCYLARGDRDRAAAEYAAVLQTQPSSSAAQEGLRAAQTAPPARAAVAAPQETAQAAAAVEQAAREVETSSARVSTATGNLPNDLRPAATAVKAGTDSLVTLAAMPVQAAPTATQLAVAAAAAVNEANESLCTLEQIGQGARDTAAGLERTMAAGKRAAAGALSSQETAVLTRSVLETQQAARELAELADQLPALAKGVQAAGRGAQNSADRLAQALSPGSTLADRLIAGDAAKLARQRGGKARADARAAAQRAAFAKTRSLVAEINVAAVALGPTRSAAGDNLVAYYTQTEAQTVRALREEQRLGLGEAALLLAAARSSARPAESLLTAAGDGGRITEAAQAAGARPDCINLFLKFVAKALSREAALP